MNKYAKKAEVRWADVDPNFHVRHSVYYDYGAFCRMSFLTDQGLTPAVMMQRQIGPILFREECLFKREIKLGDQLEINLTLTKMKPDASRWSMQHEIWINRETLAAVINIDGAWIDTGKRKLTTLPDDLKTGFLMIPKSSHFEVI